MDERRAIGERELGPGDVRCEPARLFSVRRPLGKRFSTDCLTSSTGGLPKKTNG
jgi:hypothetical protein